MENNIINGKSAGEINCKKVQEELEEKSHEFVFWQKSKRPFKMLEEQEEVLFVLISLRECS